MRRNQGWLALSAIAAAIFVLPLLRGVFDFPLFYLVFLYSILFWTAQATSWNILSGFSGYFSFGQGAFYGVGVYTMAVLFGRQGLPWLLALVMGGVFALVLALAIGTVAFRLRSLRGEIFALLTLAVPFILASVARITNAIDGGLGVIIPVPEYPGFIGSFQEFVFLLGGVIAVLALVASYLMSSTRYGWALFAIHDAEDVAEGLGVPTFRHKMIAIGLNGLIAGLSGAASALQIGYVSVEGTFSLRVPLFVIVMSVLGGRRSWAGPMLGAIYIVTLQNRLAAAEWEGWSLIILGVSLVLLVVLAPDGLAARYARRPYTVGGVFVATLAALALYGQWGDPVTWLAVALGVAALVAFLPGGRLAGGRRLTTGRLGEAAIALGDEQQAVSEMGRPLVEATDIAKSFGGVHALRGVSMSISEGELVGLVGPNGSGKTTLVNLVSGTYLPGSGSITMNGVDLVGLAPHRVAHLGMLLWALIVGLSFPVVVLMSEGLPPLLLTAIRFAIAALAVGLLVWREPDRWPGLPGLALYAVMGLCLAGFFGTMFWAAHRTTALSMATLYVSVPLLAYGLGRGLGVELRAGNREAAARNPLGTAVRIVISATRRTNSRSSSTPALPNCATASRRSPCARACGDDQ